MEVFHENILQTFIFCFLASLGIIQIMVGRRGWHGLSIYGGRARRNVNNALGTALIIFAYAWYFSNPEHRNTRNIEGFMSLVCLVLGIIAAVAATAILASVCEALRRRWSRRRLPQDGKTTRRIALPEGMALLSSDWGSPGRNLVVIAEPGMGSERVLRRLGTALPEGRGFLSLQPLSQQGAESRDNIEEAWSIQVSNMLGRLEEQEGLRVQGETFMGLGWGSDGLLRMRPQLEDIYQPVALLAVAPIIPDYSQGLLGDALLSNTPLDIGDTLARRKPWRGSDFREMLRIWWPILAACVILATVVTLVFDIRWKFFSGPLMGLILSLWITYFVASWRGLVKRVEGQETREVRLMSSLHPAAEISPLRVVVTSEDSGSLETLPGEVKAVYPSASLEVWNDVLRGKFFLKEGTLTRLVNLICGEEKEGLPD